MIRPIYPEAGPPLDDLTGFLLAEDRPTGGWVMVNMVVSVDGATARGGGATGLTDEDDQAVFQALRGVADLILVGASTVRVEDYGPVSLPAPVADARRLGGRDAPPRLVVVSRSLALDVGSRLFSDPDRPPVILTCSASPPGRRKSLGEVAEVMVVGTDDVDLGVALRLLGGVVLSEGGPTLNRALVREDLIDEVNLSTAPTVAGGVSERIVAPGPAVDQPYSLDRLLMGDRTLFARWLRRRVTA